MIHELKTWPRFYGPINAGIKNFEIRMNDRGFDVGDVLILREYDPVEKAYSGDFTIKRVLYLTDFQLAPGYVCMSISAHWNAKDVAELRAVRKVQESFELLNPI